MILINIWRGIVITIEKHLNEYSLFKFESFQEIEEYAYSNFPELSEKEIEMLNNREMADSSNSLLNNLKFYNEVASSNALRSIILSEKFGSYVKCSETILNTLKNPKKILDIGCNVGYLTTWYAKNFVDSMIIGIDNSTESINYANKMKNKMQIDNVHFQAMDLNYMKFSRKSFDAIIDTQSIYYSEKRSKVFSLIQKLITDNGLLITAPAIGELEKIELYLSDIRQSDLIIKSFDFIKVKNLGDFSHYPFIVADLHSIPTELGLEEKFKKLT